MRIYFSKPIKTLSRSTKSPAKHFNYPKRGLEGEIPAIETKHKPGGRGHTFAESVHSEVAIAAVQAFPEAS